MAWCSGLGAALHLEEEDWLGGKHVLVVDTERCSGAALLLCALLSLEAKRTHVVCVSEAPMHYQHLYHKYGGVDAGKVEWTDLREKEHPGQLLRCVEQKEGRDCVVMDSWFPLQCEGVSALDCTATLRGVRKALGQRGALVSLVHGDTMTSEEMALFVYEADLVMHVREVSSADVTGRLSLTWRGQAEPREALFTVTDNQVVFRPV